MKDIEKHEKIDSRPSFLVHVICIFVYAYTHTYKMMVTY